MISKNAFMRAFINPMFTLKVVQNYITMYTDITYLRTRLKAHFDNDEIKNFSIGASVGLKEVALYLIIKEHNPELVIETGVAQGISTYFILKALKENGHGRLISIDLPNFKKGGYKTSEGIIDTVHIPKNMSPGWIVPENLKNQWILKTGKSQEILPTLHNISPDIFIHDSEHSYENMTFEYKWALKHMKTGLIISDDTERNTAFNDFLMKNKARIKQVKNPLSIMEIFSYST